MKNVLVIEDNVDESIRAQDELVRAGVGEFRAVATLSEGLSLMPKYNLVLSDLFFPAGDIPTEQYSQKFMPLYEQFKQRKFMATDKSKVVFGAIEQCARIFGVTPQEYVERYMPMMNTSESVTKAARQALTGIKDPVGYEKFQKIEGGIRSGANLPLGIIATGRATELGKSSVIVTSTFHHDDAFEPVRNLITVPYCDTLVDGKKDWNGGIEKLLSR
jgi:hypothetical protein